MAIAVVVMVVVVEVVVMIVVAEIKSKSMIIKRNPPGGLPSIVVIVGVAVKVVGQLAVTEKITWSCDLLRVGSNNLEPQQITT